MRHLIVFFAGGAGAVARYAIGGWVAQAAGAGFPWGTLVVNASGSFLISIVMYVAFATSAISPELRLGLTTGFLGGFTTYSTFNYETIALLREGTWLIATANVAATVVICLAAGAAGLAVARALAGA
jgi:CrcB protein